MTCVAVIQARQTSTRLPGKVLLPLAGRPVIQHLADRARRVRGVDRVWFTVPDGPGHEDLIAAIDAIDGAGLSTGPEEDLVRRFAVAARESGADTVLRLWSDCPVLDPALAAKLLQAYFGAGAAFATIPLDSGFPEGMEAHVLSAETLFSADGEATDAIERETVFPFVERQPDRFPAVHVRHARNSHRFCVLLDTPDDYARLCAVFDALHPDNPLFGVAEIEALGERRPDLFGAAPS